MNDNVIETGTELVRAELAKIEEQVLTSYTLADAIREGATVTEQKIGGWTGVSEEGAPQTCALSAGLCAARARGYA